MILLYCFLGVIAGTFTGLIPGIHTNNISIILLATPFFGTNITVFVLSMCIVQSFVDFIPAIFLGAPSADTFEGILPGHKLFLEGEAFEAVCLTVFGGIVAILVSIPLTPIIILFLTQNKDELLFGVPFVLVFALLLLVFGEKSNKKKFIAFFVIIAAGTQGILFTNQIFPLIIGYFGIPTILYSLKNKPQKIIQKENFKIENKNIFEGVIGTIGGVIVAIMPGIGSNVAAGMIKLFRKGIQPKKYLVLLGSINTSAFFFSYSVLFILNKARNGAIIALKEKIFLTEGTFLLGFLIMIIAGSLGGIITIIIAKKITVLFSHKKTEIISAFSIVAMLTTVILFNGIFGLLPLAFATALGLFVITQKVKRSTCMSSLIIPTLFFYVFILY